MEDCESPCHPEKIPIGGKFLDLNKLIKSRDSSPDLEDNILKNSPIKLNENPIMSALLGNLEIKPTKKIDL